MCPRVASRRRSTRSPRPSLPGAGCDCWTCTQTPTTTARCSRSRASRGGSPKRCSQARGWRSSGSTWWRGAVDVMPVVYLDAAQRGAACAEALVVADEIGERLGVPVFLYGELASTDRRSASTRAELRRGGVKGLAGRIASDEVRPDFGPPRLH